MTPLGANLVDLKPFLSLDRVVLLPADIDKTSALTELATRAGRHPKVADPAAFIRAILERERVSSTGIGRGIAVPHAKIPSVDGFIITLGICRSGIDFQAKDDLPVRVLVMIAASDQERDTYLKVLATVAGRLQRPGLLDRLTQSDDPQAILDAFLA